jgi:hypothetical protein
MGIFSTVAGLAGQYLLGKKDRESASSESDRQYDLARNSIRYKVQDAKNAGIHPLYALGSQGLSSSVVSSPGYNMDISGAVDNISKAMQEKDQNSVISLQKKLLMSQQQNQNANAMESSYRADGIQLDNELKKFNLQRLKNEANSGATARNPLNDMKGYDSSELEEKVGSVWSEVYQLGRVPYNYVKKMIESDPKWYSMPIPKLVAQIMSSYNRDYKQTKVRDPKSRFKQNRGY